MSDQTPPIFGHCAFGQHEWPSTSLTSQPCKCGEITVIKSTVLATLTARCEALEKDRDKWKVSGNVLANEKARALQDAIDLAKRCEALTAEREHLRVEVMTVASDPHLTWDVARPRLFTALASTPTPKAPQ